MFARHSSFVHDERSCTVVEVQLPEEVEKHPYPRSACGFVLVGNDGVSGLLASGNWTWMSGSQRAMKLEAA